MANSTPKNDGLSSAEPCALYYFPEIPDVVNRDAKAGAPARFTTGTFKQCNEQESPGPGNTEETGKDELKDSAQVQSMVEEAFNNGVDQGRVETKAAIGEQIKSAVAALEAGLKEMQRVRQHDVERMEAETVRLALAIAKKIVGHETRYYNGVQHVVKQAMEKVNDTRYCIIKLNPRDIEAIQSQQIELLPEAEPGSVFQITADEGIKRGGCVIETKLGDIDARIEEQLKIIEELLVDQIPKPKNID